LLVLDLNLPGMDGISILKNVRQRKPSVPVMILSARSRVDDRVQCLDTGADDYLVKPFSFLELSARARALLRRSHLPSESVLAVRDLRLDRVERRVERGGRRIDLTTKEFALLEYLMRNAGRRLTRAMIIEHDWNLTFDSTTNVVDVYINYLRRKVDDGFSPALDPYRPRSWIPAQFRRSRGMSTGSSPPGSLPDQHVLGELLHSLSQPLTSLRCSLELSIDEDAAQAHETVAAALEQTERVIGVVKLMQEFLDFEPTEAKTQPVPFAPAVRRVLEDLSVLAEARRVRFHIQGTCGVAIPVSQPRLLLALQYLIGPVVEAQPANSAIGFVFEDREFEAVLTVSPLPALRRQAEGDVPPKPDRVGATMGRVRMAIARRVFESAGATLQFDERARPGFYLLIPRS
jgi:DNA-binding response OmpR family regulator